MLRRIGWRAAAVVVGTALPLALTAGTAWAPKYILGAGGFGRCVIDGQDESRFHGDVTVVSFHADGGQLLMTTGTSGQCLDGLDTVATVPAATVTWPVVELETHCSSTHATVQFRPGSATVGGFLGADEKTGDAVKFTVDLFPSTVLERTWSPGDPPGVRGRLCAIDRMAAHRSPAELVQILNRMLLVA